MGLSTTLAAARSSFCLEEKAQVPSSLEKKAQVPSSATLKMEEEKEEEKKKKEKENEEDRTDLVALLILASFFGTYLAWPLYRYFRPWRMNQQVYDKYKRDAMERAKRKKKGPNDWEKWQKGSPNWDQIDWD